MWIILYRKRVAVVFVADTGAMHTLGQFEGFKLPCDQVRRILVNAFLFSSFYRGVHRIVISLFGLFPVSLCRQPHSSSTSSNTAATRLGGCGHS